MTGRTDRWREKDAKRLLAKIGWPERRDRANYRQHVEDKLVEWAEQDAMRRKIWREYMPGCGYRITLSDKGGHKHYSKNGELADALIAAGLAVFCEGEGE